MRVDRMTTNGLKWLQIDGGKYDYTFHPEHGWVSINWDYMNPTETAPNRIGIRWALNNEDVDSVSLEDRLWVRKNEN